MASLKLPCAKRHYAAHRQRAFGVRHPRLHGSGSTDRLSLRIGGILWRPRWRKSRLATRIWTSTNSRSYEGTCSVCVEKSLRRHALTFLLGLLTTLASQATFAELDNTVRAQYNWVMHCQGCHGADAQGTPGGVPRLLLSR